MNAECPTQRKWYWFIMADSVTYFGGLLLLVIWKFSTKFLHQNRSKISQSMNLEASCRSQKNLENLIENPTFSSILRSYVNQLISTQYLIGRIVASIVTISALLSTILYLYEIVRLPLQLEKCYPLTNPIFCSDLACNLVFLVYFLLRFFTSTEKLALWLGFHTIIDCFTIPQILTALVLDQEWIGLRFVRVLSLIRVPEVIQCFNVIKSGTSIRVIQLITYFASILIGGAGFFHLLENSGEITSGPFYNNSQAIGYGDSLYFIIVTMSTVGYGDICAKTISGKIFVALFILLALATFASFIPELAEFLFARSQYLGSYIKKTGRRHIIVCGHINYSSVSTFLTDFLHEDRSSSDVDVIFINKKEPDIEMKSLLKIYFTQVKYFQGTVMDQLDLDRVQMSNADACLILADQNCPDPNDEDAGNIMRAISFKNYCYRCPVIIQLLQFENKTYLQNIPTWNKRNGDQIICYSEIELGILAQSCLVPGFSTLLTNIFSVRSEKECKQSPMNENWLNDYMRGVTMEIYSAKLSRSFAEYSYRELVEFCFKNLNLLLIAIEVSDCESKKKMLLMNPLNCTKIVRGSIGFFICDSFRDALNANIYCSRCHATLRDLTNLKVCGCNSSPDDYELTVISRLKSEEEVSLTKCDPDHEFKELEFIDEKCVSYKKNGQFYTCPPQKLMKNVISSEHQIENLRGHIILCIFSDKMTSSIGMRNFLMPLRSASIPENELKELVIIAEKDFIEKEWSEICGFPKIKVVFHQISIRRIAHLISIETCSRCVILNNKTNIADLQNDAYMVDKEIIIANLFFQAESKRRILKNNSKIEMSKSTTSEVTNGETQLEKITQSNSEGYEMFQINKSPESQVPIISKLAIESNVQYLDVKEDSVLNIPNYLRKPFAFGCAFTTSMLDSLMSTAYYNQNAIYIMEMLINGGSVDDLDQDDNDPEINLEQRTNQFRINLTLVSQINKTVNWSNSVFYRDIFIELLSMHESVSLGLYRKRNLLRKETATEAIDRYVITNPPANFPIEPTDMVYCLQQKCFTKWKNNKFSPLSSVEQK